MKLAPDANVVVAGLAFRGAASLLLQTTFSGTHEFVISEEAREEVLEVLREKFPRLQREAEEALSLLMITVVPRGSTPLAFMTSRPCATQVMPTSLPPPSNRTAAFWSAGTRTSCRSGPWDACGSLLLPEPCESSSQVDGSHFRGSEQGKVY